MRVLILLSFTGLSAGNGSFNFYRTIKSDTMGSGTIKFGGAGCTDHDKCGHNPSHANACIEIPSEAAISPVHCIRRAE